MTRDALTGAHEQLSATSLMTYQNRLALDFLLAEKGGVCAVIQQDCCVFILKNTAPDGSFTKALHGLRALSEELAKNSGINNPVTEWFEKTFGKWKPLVTSVLISLISAGALLTFCGCCCIPCTRHLCLKCITTAINDKFQAPPAYQLMQKSTETIPLTGYQSLEDEEDPEHRIYFPTPL